ncbi:hypothetical protein LZ554_006382 [Drepanopeziza brunnea f. sp. 'monogermtubi']|nr:hypothetical protein LZ554_006382 [Drepanopeziza brunnea f. sp. 'monogermtubi']
MLNQALWRVVAPRDGTIGQVHDKISFRRGLDRDVMKSYDRLEIESPWHGTVGNANDTRPGPDCTGLDLKSQGERHQNTSGRLYL